MLSKLYIENIAVIEKAEITFQNGFNVLTGETGAGKSILIDSIFAILGRRTSKELVRTGAANALVQAAFTDLPLKCCTYLSELGYEIPDGELLLSRQISADGKNQCKLNGKPILVSMLKDLAPYLVDIHGQHDNQNLTDPKRHISYLDDYGEIFPLKNQYREKFHQLSQVVRKLQAISGDEQERERTCDMLRFQIEEISSCNLREGEEEELLSQRKVIRNAQNIRDSLQKTYLLLNGDEYEMPGIVNTLQQADQSLSSIAEMDARLQMAYEKVQALYYEAEEISDMLRDLCEEYEFDQQALEEIEERLHTIYKLKQKYGNSIAEILTFAENAQVQLRSLVSSEEELESLTLQKDQLLLECRQLANQLTKAREKTAKQFCSQVKKELSYLNMPSVQFEVKRTETPLRKNGADEWEFLISVNPGEPPKPLTKIASGGELSRIMLAIKSVLSKKDPTPTLIFDEIDTGVSGSAAQKIGCKLREISQNHQVFCVTHLAQIAVLADHHFLIEKRSDDKRTFTEVTPLDHAERIREIARITGGDTVTDLSLKNAEEMLSLSKEWK